MSEKFYKTSQVYLERILEHALKIKKYKAGLTFEIFNNQNQEYDAICMQLSQIGENVSKIEKMPDRIIDHFPNAINWKSLKGLRNRIDHDYTWLEPEKIWAMLENNIEELEEGTKEILKKRFGVIR